MTAPVERLLAALRGHGYTPKRSGDGWACRCPAHDDRNPSLSIHRGDNGGAVVHCHASAGCTYESIIGAVGLRPADLLPERTNGHGPASPRWASPSPKPGLRRTARGSGQGEGSGSGPRTFATADAAVKALERQHGPRAALWTYTDAAGEPVGLVVRWDLPPDPADPEAKPRKLVQPVSRLAQGWANKGMATPRPLYRLPDLLATPPGSRVYVAEGEKAADAACSAGLLATTSPHGAKSAGKADWSAVSGREVVILPDHDEAGERYAAEVAPLAVAAGAKSVRIVRLWERWPDLPPGGDIANLAKGTAGDAEALAALVRAIGELADRADPAGTHAAPLADFRPFPVSALPKPLSSFVAKGAKAIRCDPSYIALPLLSGLASAIGNTHRIELKHGWAEPAILWTAIVGESGTAKSPAMELALRAVRDRQHDALKRHALAMEDYRDAQASYEREAAQWRQGKSDGPPPAKPPAPTASRCWTDDTTTEALAVLLQQNPRGLLMIRDELAGWFNFDRYAGGKGGDAAKWLEIFGGRPMVVDRKGAGTLYIPRAAMSIAGGIQPETLRRALGQEHRDNGLAARLLVACPPRVPKRWTEAVVDPGTEAAVAAVFGRLYSLTAATGASGDPSSRLVTLAPDGKEAWVRFFNAHAAEQAELSGDLSAVWSKLEGYAARLALVVHLCRWAAADPALADPARVDGASIAAGVTLARWFGDEARRVYDILAESEEDRECRRLLDLIRRKGGSISGRELVQSTRAYRTVEDAETALARLVGAGLGSWVTPGQRGRGGPKAKRFTLVCEPGVNVYRNVSGGPGAGDSVDVDGADTPPTGGAEGGAP